jgi:hypothetical protein
VRLHVPIVAALFVLVAVPAGAETPHRAGLTVEGGWGLGYTAAVAGQRATEGNLDATSVGIGVGGFLTSNWALLGRVGPSHGYSVISSSRLIRVTQTPLAGVLQWFPGPRWMLAAGGALMIRVTDEATRDSADSKTHRGAGAVLRAGHGFANWDTLGMRLTLELVLSRYGEDMLVSSSLGFEVQSF